MPPPGISALVWREESLPARFSTLHEACESIAARQHNHSGVHRNADYCATTALTAGEFALMLLPATAATT